MIFVVFGFLFFFLWKQLHTQTQEQLDPLFLSLSLSLNDAHADETIKKQRAKHNEIVFCLFKSLVFCFFHPEGCKETKTSSLPLHLHLLPSYSDLPA